ncbi:SDR family oxidoreductase [Metabacillus sp. KIGAM252]|uniref:SDR family oxidoreductase n=1 Tax=Metabacillus flavus TaxID=2823519 RepID=A0ABS5LCP8_9BACI|nr:SDR family oxidoreductase [Metabacillus flavus]MBS2968530.1 SDR family oxidoreductase [Metabacillus flavus]
MKKCFITGFPGFISRELIKEAVQQNLFDYYYVLVLPEFAERADKELNLLAAGKAEAVTGDITKEGLNINPAILKGLEQEVTHVFHLAAIYDLGVDEEFAKKVNVTGTENVIEWALTLNLECFTYFSTAYVSGKRTGEVFEGDLEDGHSFKNHYESTKYMAEKLVRTRMNKLPAVIIRPGIVTGNSKTGETSKFDGPYYMLNMFSKLKFLPATPRIGKGNVLFNTVPVDFLVNAVLYLSLRKEAAGHTFHVTDPNPGTIGELYDLFLKELLNRKTRGSIPPGAAKLGLSSKAVCNWLGTRKEALDYFQYDVRYDCTNLLHHLEGSGIACPNIREYGHKLVHYYKEKQFAKEEKIHA